MKKAIKTILALVLCTVLLGAFCSCDMNGDDTGESDMVRATANPTFSLSPMDTSPSPMMTDGDDIGEEIGDTIKDFAEGTIEDIADLPDIVKAITDKYDGATVSGITHAMHLGQQTYEVKFTDSKGVTKTAYVSPDGKTVTEATDAASTDDAQASPKSTD